MNSSITDAYFVLTDSLPQSVYLDQFIIYKLRSENILEKLYKVSPRAMPLVKSSYFQILPMLGNKGKIDFYFFILSNQSLKSTEVHIAFPRAWNERFLKVVKNLFFIEDIECEELENHSIELSSLENTVDENSFYCMDQVAPLLHYVVMKLVDNTEGRSLDTVDRQSVQDIGQLAHQPRWNFAFFEDESEMDQPYLLSTLYYPRSDKKTGCYPGQESVSKTLNQSSVPLVEFGLYFDLETKRLKESKSIGGDDVNFQEYFQNKKYKLISEEYGLYSGKIKKAYRNNISHLCIQSTESESLKILRKDLMERGLEEFRKDRDKEALKIFSALLSLDPQNQECLELIGVLLGRLEKFENGIFIMNNLEAVNPDLIMPHTNKSLFYMKLGNIEAAEKEKSESTFKHFLQLGKSAEEKKQAQRDELEAENKRISMFNEVLEIDPSDEIALFGLAEIYVKRKDLENSNYYLDLCEKYKYRPKKIHELRSKILSVK